MGVIQVCNPPHSSLPPSLVEWSQKPYGISILIVDAAPLTKETFLSMRTHFRLPLIIVLAGVLLTSTVSASPHLIVHEFDHGNHHSNSHSSPLCAWFCAAGHAMDSAFHLTDTQPAGTEALDSFHPSPTRNVLPSHPFTRGPPSEA